MINIEMIIWEDKNGTRIRKEYLPFQVDNYQDSEDHQDFVCSNVLWAISDFEDLTNGKDSKQYKVW